MTLGICILICVVLSVAAAGLVIAGIKLHQKKFYIGSAVLIIASLLFLAYGLLEQLIANGL